jgi:hypothetical protein
MAGGSSSRQAVSPSQLISVDVRERSSPGGSLLWLGAVGRPQAPRSRGTPVRCQAGRSRDRWSAGLVDCGPAGWLGSKLLPNPRRPGGSPTLAKPAAARAVRTTIIAAAALAAIAWSRSRPVRPPATDPGRPVRGKAPAPASTGARASLADRGSSAPASACRWTGTTRTGARSSSRSCATWPTSQSSAFHPSEIVRVSDVAWSDTGLAGCRESDDRRQGRWPTACSVLARSARRS